MIPKFPRRRANLAPDQIFSAGYRDGLHHRAPHPLFQDNLHYLKGYTEGCRSVSEPPPLIAFNRSSNLETALLSIHLWEQDQQRFGCGTVALSYRSGWWIVLVSKDLHDKALPF